MTMAAHGPQLSDNPSLLESTQIREYFDGEYRIPFDSIFDSPTCWRFKAMGNDHTNQQVDQGSLIHHPLPPPEKLGTYPRAQDERLDFVLENLMLQGRNQLANIMAIGTVNHFKFSPYSAASITGKYEALAEEEDGTQVADEGVADVMRDPIEFATTKRNKFSIFEVHAANIKGDTLRFAICDSPICGFLDDKILWPLATNFVKEQIVKYVCPRPDGLGDMQDRRPPCRTCVITSNCYIYFVPVLERMLTLQPEMLRGYRS
ncbi:hypothetical protein D9619_013746 [Psilocybe cf. subviscida]|uniref:HAM1-like N-terminal domain-containing protein n=1 Tax=Psilocybe cf. subviscida TaxID=2480587 RepID=A0A8H5B033_9AGAR|nr:hypothetical protein D9619_013746 [Psilocybe cf. subviscida]